MVATEDVEDVDDVDAIEEEELARCGVFRGMSIRETSSVIEFKPPCPPLPGFHPSRGWKLGGEATAVIRSNECLTKLSELPLNRSIQPRCLEVVRVETEDQVKAAVVNEQRPWSVMMRKIGFS